MLFAIDAVNGTLYTQNPPNSGTLATPVALGVSASVVGGFDIDGRNNKGYAVMTVGGARNLYAINLGAASAAASLVAPLALSEDVKGFALRTPRAPVVYGLTDRNLRINVDTGAATTDGAINRAGAAPVVAAGAYTNSFAGTTATMLLVLDSDSDNLALQNPPNDGTLANIGALGLNLSGDNGMDIAGGANGLALAALCTASTGPSRLYRVDLVTGAALPINGAANPALSLVGAGTLNVIDIAISLK